MGLTARVWISGGHVRSILSSRTNGQGFPQTYWRTASRAKL